MIYDLNVLGAWLPRRLMLVEEFDHTYTPDANAPAARALPGEFGRMLEDSAVPLLMDARLLAAHVADNDQEIWFLTRRGEFVRVTGEGSAQFYLVHRDDAPIYLEEFADGGTVLQLKKLGLLT